METNSNVQVISKVILKPSSQTPDHLKTIQLSMIDRLQGPAYIRIVFFYQADELINGLTSCGDTNRAQISEKLKKSLSDTLTTFYPLAGKIDHNTFTIVCNDNGVVYVEARVHARVSDAIQDPTPEQLKTYLPVSSVIVVDNVLLCVQINFFDCGGIAVGLCLSHQIADGISAVTFMNYWADACRTGGIANRPKPIFNLAYHFPMREIHKTDYLMLQNLFVREEEYVTKRFVFDKEKMAALRKLFAAESFQKDDDALKDPTRVELVSAFLWKHFIESSVSKKASVTTHAVSMRNRMGIEGVFGNCFANQVAMFDHHHGCPSIHDLARDLRSKLRAVDSEFIRKLQSQEEDPFAQTFDQLSTEGEGYSVFASWCRFPLYEVDYGWGKPVWIGTPAFPMSNSVILLDDQSGEGIEAWVNALPDSIQTLKTRLKLLS